MRYATQSAFVALAILVTTAPASARPGNPNAGRRHDPGHFFMRLSGGFGFSKVTFDDGLDTTLSGFGGLGSFMFGATVAPNLALGVDLFGLGLFEPTLSQRGSDLGDVDNTRANVAGIGLGVTYYFMPVNLYVSASIGAGIGTLRFRGRIAGIGVTAKEDSKVGLAANVMIGKEWWVSRKWGLGLAGQVVFANLETDNGTGLGAVGFGLVFSATMN